MIATDVGVVIATGSQIGEGLRDDSGKGFVQECKAQDDGAQP